MPGSRRTSTVESNPYFWIEVFSPARSDGSKEVLELVSYFLVLSFANRIVPAMINACVISRSHSARDMAVPSFLVDLRAGKHPRPVVGVFPALARVRFTHVVVLILCYNGMHECSGLSISGVPRLYLWSLGR